MLTFLAASIFLIGCGENDTLVTPTETPKTVASPTHTPTAKPTMESNLGDAIMHAGNPVNFGPAKGQTLHVVGVAHNDQLNLRAAPDPQSPILTRLAPESLPVTSLGHGWQLPSGAIWWQVEFRDGVKKKLAWANIKYLAALGGSTDVSNAINRTNQVAIDDLQDLISIQLLGDTAKIHLVIIEAAQGLDAQGGVMQFDLLGFRDDAVRGERIRVVFDFIWEGSGTTRRASKQATIRMVFSTPICARGSHNGKCI